MSPPTADHGRLVAAALAAPLLVPVIAGIGLWSGYGLALLLGGIAWLVTATTVQAQGWHEPWNAIDALANLRGHLLSAGAAYGEQGGATFDLLLYLPTLAFWSALSLAVLAAARAALRRRRVRAGPVTVAAGTADLDLVRLWYLVAGAALLLNQYPRMDEAHLLWSGGLLFVVGADVLQRWHHFALRWVPALDVPSGRAALAGALVALPALAALPLVNARIAGANVFFRPAAPPAELTRPEGPYGLLPLDVPGDAGRVWLPAKDALVYETIVDALREATAEGEPIFAYPAMPGFYYLADRPNATAFNHLFPGMASPAAQQEMVRQLERVRFVVWDDGGAHFWVKPGDNAPVTEYLRTHFRIERFAGPYAILSRRAVDAWGEPLAYDLPSTLGTAPAGS
jgi:hypothetical protein